MKKSLSALLVASSFLVSLAATAATVEVTSGGANPTMARDNATQKWHTTYPNGTFWGIKSCTVSFPVPMCTAWGDNGAPTPTPPPTYVTVTAFGGTAASCVSTAVSNWNATYPTSQYPNATLIGTESHNNTAGAGAPWACSATGTI